MPQGLPAEYYAGKNGSGVPIFWLAYVPPPSVKISGDLWVNSMFAAAALAAADAGVAGPRWKQLCAGAPDKASLARTIISQYQQMSDDTTAKSHQAINWVHATLHTGMQRPTVYALLKSHHLVAYNDNYNPGKTLIAGRLFGCSYGETRVKANWPRFKEPVPPRSRGCDIGESANFVVSPDAYIDFTTGFNFACGKQVQLDLKFDQRDRLSKIVDSKESESCV